MKNSLRRLTALAALFVAQLAIAPPAFVARSQTISANASASPPAANNSLSPGDRLLVEAVARLERRASVTARVRHQAEVNGQQLYGIGSYWQQGVGDDLRVRLELQISGQEARLLQISDGRFLWVDRVLPIGRTVTRVDLSQLRADPVLAAPPIDDIDPGTASWSTAQSIIPANSGGLPRLLAALADGFSFLPPQAMRMVAPNSDRQSSAPFFAVVGRWKPEKLAALMGDRESSGGDQEPKASAALPDRLPQEVLLLFGQADLFPYRIEYRALDTQASNQAESLAAYQLSNRPTAVLEFSDVTFDAPIPPSQFDYAPRDVQWVDHTASLLQRLRRERQEKIAARAGQTAPALPAR